MNDAAIELLVWARGPGMQIALGLLLFGIVLRLLEIFSLGRKVDLAPARTRAGASGWHTLYRRSLPHGSTLKRSPTTVIGGYLFHVGLFVVLLLYIPHIELIRALTGLGWPGLPSPLVDGVTVITLIALVVLLVDRLTHPVKRLLSGPDDYLSWALTVLPLVTGYLAFHHLLLDYTTMLALHILSGELLLALLPFTKLAHSFTLWLARWFNGELFGRKGVAS